MMRYKHLLAGLVLAFSLPAAVAEGVRYGVMCYHDVVDESAPAVETAGNKQMQGDFQRQYFPQTITVERLAAHFNWLRNNGYTPVSFKQIENARAGRGRLPAKPVLLTFDDGYISFYTNIYPLLKAYNYPAVFALVTGWMETPAGGTIAYGNKKLPRSAFITWEQVREMQKSGLIEIASHTHDLHRGHNGNPYGSQFAAVFPEYRNGRYETRAAYEQRLRNDLKRSVEVIAKRTGVRPNVLVWPYGQFNRTAQKIARSVGLENDFTLFDSKLNDLDQQSVGRALIDAETGYPLMKSYLRGRTFEPPHQRAVYVDLGDVYDTDAARMNQKYDKLIERIYKLGITTVYLQAFADDDGNGKAEAVYFPSSRIKTKADLFSRVAWQLMTRSNVKVYAYMPLSAFEQPDGGAVPPQTVAGIYEDLAFSSRFNGLVFKESRNDTPAGSGSAAYSEELKNAALKYSYNAANEMKTVRSLHAGGSADLRRLAQHYDYTAVTAAPYAANGRTMSRREAARFLTQLAQGVKNSNVPLDKTVFVFPVNNPQTGMPVESRELAGWMSALKKEGVKNLAYYPERFTQNIPDLAVIKPEFSVQR